MLKLPLLIFALIVGLFGFGQIPAPIPNTYINDLTGKLTKDQLFNLNTSLLDLEKTSSVQVAVVIVNDLPVDMPIEDYARRVGAKWHVGNAKNGIVYVAALNAHKQRLEVARKMEGDIPDYEAKVITGNVKPFLKSGNLYGAILSVVADIKKRVDPVAKEQLHLMELQNEKSLQQQTDGVANFFLWFLAIAVIVAVGFLIVIWYLKKKKANEEFIQQGMRDLKAKHDATFDNSGSRKFGTASYTVPEYGGDGVTKYGSNNSPDVSNNWQTRQRMIQAYEDRTRNVYISPPIIIDNSSTTSSSSSSSSDDNSSSSSSSSFGDWGSSDSSSSSDFGSSSSGFDGGGSTDTW